MEGQSGGSSGPIDRDPEKEERMIELRLRLRFNPLTNNRY
jgi:hypothetical protein